MNRRKWMLAAGGLVIAAAGSPIAFAEQKWPDKPVKLIVPFPPGGGTDTLSRTIADKLSKEKGWIFVVENRPGAGGNIGLDVVAKAAADGYTIGMGQTANLAINPSLYPKLPFDPAKDFAPITLVAEQAQVLVVSSKSPYKSLADLIKAAKENKDGGLKVALAGNGTVGHLAGELFERKAQVKFLNVPYKGAGPAMIDLLSGQVDLYFGNTQAVIPQIAGGKLRALAVTSAKRVKSLPAVPTLAESGFPGFEAVSWSGLVAPAGTPQAIVESINKEVNLLLKKPDVLERLSAEGSDPLGGSSRDYDALIKAERSKWGNLIREAGIKLE
jgi:tripartite-type tricarboxylate transporter receptor subunit TctC